MLFAKRRDGKMAEAREAAQDAVDLIQATAQRSARAARPQAESAVVSGDASDEISKDMREVEKEKQELSADLREHVERLSNAFPELRHILLHSGLTSAGVREIVISRLREANQLIYEAGLAETNRIMWENVPRIIRSRYPNAGEPQVIASQSAAAVIKLAEREKVFK